MTPIDFNHASIRSLTAEVMDPNAVQPFGVYAFAADEPGAELARHVEQVVFDDAFGNSAAMLEREYGPYEGSTMFLCVVDHRRRVPAGMMRLILPSSVGFKSLHDIETVWNRRLDDVLLQNALSLPTGEVCDITTLAVAKDYRGRAASGLVTLALYQAVGTGARRWGARWFVTILDMAVLRLLQWQVHKGFNPYVGVEPMAYLGSASSLPVWADINSWCARLQEVDAAMYDLVFDGKGLEAAVAPPDWSALVALAGRLSSASPSQREPLPALA